MRTAVVILTVTLLSACAMTPEQQEAMRALASGVSSGAQNMEQERQRMMQQQQNNQRQQPLNCMTTYSGATARTTCY